ELLSRIVDVLVFNTLHREDIHKIIDIELNKLYKRIEDIGYKLHINDEAKDFLVDKGYDKEYGARPLNRAIQKYVEDALAEEIINANLHEGDSIEMELDKENDQLNVTVLEPKV